MLESAVDSYVELPVLGGVQRIWKVVEQLLDLVWTKKIDEKNREMVYFPMAKKTYIRFYKKSKPSYCISHICNERRAASS